MRSSPFFKRFTAKRRFYLPLSLSLLNGCVPMQQQAMQQPGQPVAATIISKADSVDLSGSFMQANPGNTPEWVQVGRYRAINAVPTQAQQALLQVMVTVTLPNEVKTIKAAVQYVLLRSGYQLTQPKKGGNTPSGASVANLLSKPIPSVHRHLGPMTLQAALETLAGSPYLLKVDAINREVSYGLPVEFVQKGKP